MKTSVSDPIRVDFIVQHIVDAPGRLGLTIAPGKRDATRGWQRDLDADLLRLRRSYHAAMLVSLMEDHEHDLLGIPDLLERAKARRLEVRRLPIRDVSVPSPAQLPALRALVADVCAALDRGATVVVHCRGGLGRSGLVAACVLVARGSSSAQAIAAVRAARPGAIETRAQEDFVHAFSPEPDDPARQEPHRVIDLRHIDLDAPPPPRAAAPEDPPLDRVRGCLLGGALGDALGYPVEFLDRAAIVRQLGHGTPDCLKYGGAEGLVSDDTQMTLFVAEGLVRAVRRIRGRGICNPHAVGLRALLRWHATQTGGSPGEWPGWLVADRRLHAQRAPGMTCMSALAARADKPDFDLLPARNDSKGCGGVMRAAPFGFLASPILAFEHAVTNAAFTHGHPTGSLAAGAFAATIWHLARGAAPAAAIDQAAAILADRPRHDETSRALAGALAASAEPLTAAALERLGGGWVADEALAIAVACLLHHDPTRHTVADTLWLAACHSGDSDSTAAITGNLLGAWLGAAALPSSWLEDLELRDVIDRLARDLWSCFYEHRDLDDDDYPPC